MLFTFWLVIIVLGILSIGFSGRLARLPELAIEDTDRFKRERVKFVAVGVTMLIVAFGYAVLFSEKVFSFP